MDPRDKPGGDEDGFAPKPRYSDAPLFRGDSGEFFLGPCVVEALARTPSTGGALLLAGCASRRSATGSLSKRKALTANFRLRRFVAAKPRPVCGAIANPTAPSSP